jgi:glutathione S-transferase
MLTLYYSPGACSLAPHFVLEELGEPFTAQRLVIAEGQNRTPEYLALNPTGQVPTLVVDPAVPAVITQNVAILTFLAHRAPDKRLLPADPLQEAQAISQMAWLSSTVHPAFGRWFRPDRATADKDAAPGVKSTAKEAIKGYFGDIEAKLAGRDYAAGTGFTVVDAYLYVFYRWGSRIELDMAGYKSWTAHAERLRSRPAIGRALADEGLS